MRPTPTQASVLGFIARYVHEHGYPPALRDICGHLNATSTHAAHCHVAALVRQGLLRKVFRGSRCLTITEEGHAYLEHVDFDHLMRRQLG